MGGQGSNRKSQSERVKDNHSSNTNEHSDRLDGWSQNQKSEKSQPVTTTVHSRQMSNIDANQFIEKDPNQVSPFYEDMSV